MITRSVRTRSNEDLSDRLALSAAATDAGAWLRTADFPDWLAERAAANRFQVRRIPFRELDSWYFASDTGNLRHRTGKFFSVEGLSVRVDEGTAGEWQQPIIVQPEVGILGILAKEFDGVLHFLMQAKMEPGNRNLLQLSPTVQATRSNYTGVHRGGAVRYLSHFTRPGACRVLADVLQSEHGAWFYRKSNRNMLVETVDDVAVHPDFCWLTLGQIGRLLRADNVVNMDSRTVIATFPMNGTGAVALHSDAELQSWFTAERARHDVQAERMPLAEVAGWERGESQLGRADEKFFRLVAVAVQAGNREVTAWTQPLFEPIGQGIAAFVFRRIDGVPHVLVQAKVEAGFLDTVELAPTVQCVPSNWDRLPPFLEVVLGATRDRIRYDVVHSEEGGRFLNAESRYMFVEADLPLTPPPGYCWATPAQLNWFAGHGHYLNVQARTLLANLNAGAVSLNRDFAHQM
ncbi:NDP-hexose 2,3-dehydratase family protein [Nocardia sp. CDC159]|uniref:NDP-hexose 2,3-dehydratase family protein n=1 Tax=Nocardia pulmonis TaxID=2951408 RepID=A0A9X2EFT5_9NOCA|nr:MULTISPECIES: NDP-hexose 2,3-dehydratase family protein [Nocardia]MCM6778710.1 NDP-hexose 2,3-dehydratase family protein [Nocardia pulmonis]MCM6791599.1 NDP-hexose 2,3-dehydratase family protein [Nocardia sp. CDC159]